MNNLRKSILDLQQWCKEEDLQEGHTLYDALTIMSDNIDSSAQERAEIGKFIGQCRDWLQPLGYQEIYKNNHPAPDDIEIHFIKDQIRVICKRQKDYVDSFHLHYDIMQPISAMTSVLYSMSEESIRLDELFDQFNGLVSKLKQS